MSIVVAVKKGKQLVIGADTQSNFGSNKPCEGNIHESKIRRVGSAFLATTSWGLYDDIFSDYLSGRKSVRLNSKLAVFRFFTGFWHVLHKKYSFVNDQCDEKDSPFGDLDATFMIVTKTRIFRVSSDMSVTEFLKFHAIGSGSNYATGAMYVLYEQDLSAEEIARRALDAAIVHNIYCGGEVELLKP
jgi:ATP-dependent protease HslVU (ClpYQ) peptidase subunit